MRRFAGTNPVQYRTKYLDWADRALPPFQEAFLAKEPRMVFCAMVDRNGFLPVHNKIYSHPQRPGDVAWNTANSRNRRIFNDPAGLAAGAQPALLSDPELRARHGQREDGDDARDRRPDPRQGPALGRFPHRLQALRRNRSRAKSASAGNVNLPSSCEAPVTSRCSSALSACTCRAWQSRRRHRICRSAYDEVRRASPTAVCVEMLEALIAGSTSEIGAAD